jgi:hypothetical protein
MGVRSGGDNGSIGFAEDGGRRGHRRTLEVVATDVQFDRGEGGNLC